MPDNENVIANILRKRSRPPVAPAAGRPAAEPVGTVPAPARADDAASRGRTDRSVAPAESEALARRDVLVLLSRETSDRLVEARLERRVAGGTPTTFADVVAEGLRVIDGSTGGEFPVESVSGPTGTCQRHIRMPEDLYTKIIEIQAACGGRAAVSVSAIVAACIESVGSAS